MRRGRRRGTQRFAAPLGGGKARSDEPDGGGFDVALAAGDLAGKTPARIGFQPQRFVEQLGRIEEGVAVQAAEPGEFRILQAGNGAEDAHLLAVFQFGLETDHVEQRAEFVVLAQLHDCVGLDAGAARIGQAERLHRAVAQRLAAALGHHLDRQAAVEIGRRRFPIVEFGFIAGDQCVDEGVVLFARQRAIDVVGAGAARAGLVVARLEPGLLEVDRFAMHDRRDGVEEGERVFAGQSADAGREVGRGKRAGGDDHAVPFGGRQRHFAALERNRAAAPRAPP